MRSDLIFFLIVAIVVIAGYVISRRPRMFLMAVLLISIPWQGGLWMPFVMEDLRLVYILLFLILIDLKISGSKLKKGERFYHSITLSALAIIGWALLSTLTVAVSIKYGLKGVFFFTMNLALFYCVINTLKTPDDVAFFMKWYLIALLFQSTVAILQFYDIIFKMPIIGDVRAGEMYWRKSGTFLHPNQCGMYHMMMLPLALRMIIWSVLTKNSKQIAFYSIIFSMGILGIMTTFNRGSWVGLSLGVIIMFGYQLFQRGNRKVKRVLLRVSLVGLVGFILFSAKYGSTLMWRLFSGDVEGIKAGRYELQQGSYSIIRASPILGVAPWNYQFHMTTAIFVHNLYLLIAAENGLVGLLFFIWFLVAYLREIHRGIKSKFLFVSNISFGLLASLIGFIFSSYVGPDYFISHSVGLNLWALAGLSVVLNRIDRMVRLAQKKQIMKQPETESRSNADVAIMPENLLIHSGSGYDR